MQLKTKAGLALITLGISVFAAWNWWTKTRNFVPLDLPVSLAAGHSVSVPFKLNFDALYWIEIDAEKTIPLDTLHCLMGVDANAVQCKDIPPAISANWVLSSNAQEQKHGTSAELHTDSSVSPGVVRVIGEFQGKSGREYTLQLTSAADGSRLAAAQPRLKVVVASIAYTDLQSAGVLVFSTAFICVFFGVILLGVAFYAKRRAKSV